MLEVMSMAKRMSEARARLMLIGAVRKLKADPTCRHSDAELDAWLQKQLEDIEPMRWLMELYEEKEERQRRRRNPFPQ